MIKNSFLLVCFVQGFLNNVIGQKFVSIKVVAPEQKNVTYGEILPLTFEGTTKRGKVKVFEPITAIILSQLKV